MTDVILNGIFTLSGVILGSVLTFLLTYLANKGKLLVYIQNISCEARQKQDEETGDRLSTKKIFDKNNESLTFMLHLFIHNSKNTNISMSRISLEFKDERKRSHSLSLKDLNTNISTVGFMPKSIDSYNFYGKSTTDLYLRTGINIAELKKFVLFNYKTQIQISY